MSDNRPPRYIDPDGRIIYRASSLGMCDKVFVALALGYDPKAHPAWFQDILDEGTEQESIIREAYETKYEQQVVDVGRVLEMEVLEGVWIRGSIDGIVEASDIGHQRGAPPSIWDAKKIRTSGWARYLRVGVEFQANYPMQFSAYMHMWEDQFGVMPDFIMAGGHYEALVKSGEDESDAVRAITEVERHTYTDPMVSLRAIKQVIVRRERLIAETEVIGDIACTTKMYPCPFYYLHDEDDAYEPPTRPSDETVAPLLREWAELDAESKPLADAAAKLKKLQDRKKQLQDGVMAWMQLSGQESGAVSSVTVDDTEFAVKYLVSPRNGYTVDPGEQTRVTIRVTAKDGQTVAKAPKPSAVKSAAKKAAAPAKKAGFPAKPNTKAMDL
jgi:hypothetical protein